PGGLLPGQTLPPSGSQAHVHGLCDLLPALGIGGAGQATADESSPKSVQEGLHLFLRGPDDPGRGVRGQGAGPSVHKVQLGLQMYAAKPKRLAHTKLVSVLGGLGVTAVHRVCEQKSPQENTQFFVGEVGEGHPGVEGESIAKRHDVPLHAPGWSGPVTQDGQPEFFLGSPVVAHRRTQFVTVTVQVDLVTAQVYTALVRPGDDVGPVSDGGVVCLKRAGGETGELWW